MNRKLKSILASVTLFRRLRKFIDLTTKYFNGVFSNKMLKKLIPSISRNSYFRNMFFGYYDVSPFKPDDSSTVVLICNNQSPIRKPSKRIYSSIVLFDIKENKIIREIGKTRSWNWQQGARAQWVNSKKIIYNTYDIFFDDYRAVCYDIETESSDIYDFPVQSVGSDFFVSISYKALNLYRPDYGYCNHNKVKTEREIYLKKVYLENGISEDILTKDEILGLITNVEGNTNNIDSFWINHVTFSKDAINLVFLLRYKKNYVKKTILVNYNFSTDTYEIITFGNISHYTWFDSISLLVYLINENSGFYKIDLLKKQKSLFLNSPDGHPVITTDKDLIVDTYPDNFGIQSLLLYPGQDKEKILFEYRVPPIYFELTRCDMHPSIDSRNEVIQIDIIWKNRKLADFIRIQE